MQGPCTALRNGAQHPERKQNACLTAGRRARLGRSSRRCRVRTNICLDGSVHDPFDVHVSNCILSKDTFEISERISLSKSEMTFQDNICLLKPGNPSTK